jgi:uncharacterized protein
MSHLQNGARQRFAAEAHRAVVDSPRWIPYHAALERSSRGPFYPLLFWSEHMDVISPELPVFLIATFAGALVAGLSGFAFGLVAASIWLYILTPLQSASLIIAFGLVVQGYSVWKLRHALDWRRLWPFIVGAAVGAPFGVTLLTWANPQHVKVSVGVFLVLYSLYALFRPAMGPIKSAGAASDAGVGLLNGILGGMTGLAGILVTLWCGLRGWPKDVQRAVFQPVAVAIFVMSALWLGAKGAITIETIKLFVVGLPALFAGTWVGLKLYGRLNEANFRKVVLVLLLASGTILIL